MKIIFIFVLLLILPFGIKAQIPGCTDPQANNYDPNATVNDGSCTYNPTAYNPNLFMILPGEVNETSGLIFYNDGLWTHNDSGNHPEIYKIDTVSGQIVQTITLSNAQNVDWEDMAQDENFIYVGDFGNNAGSRDDLRIYRVSKSDIPVSGNAAVPADIIDFHYSDQTKFKKSWRSHNFDCEAMIVNADSIYLFSKNWLNEKTKLYTLPKVPGDYTAQRRFTYDIQGLVTGASLNENENEITLCGYKNNVWIPFICLLWDYQGDDFFSGNKRRIDFPYIITSQTEGVAYYQSKKIFISAEKTQTFSQRLYNLDTGIWTTTGPTYVEPVLSEAIDFSTRPNPVKGSTFKVVINDLPGREFSFQLFDSTGRLLYINDYVYDPVGENLTIKFVASRFTPGLYLLKIISVNDYATRKIIIE